MKEYLTDKENISEFKHISMPPKKMLKPRKIKNTPKGAENEYSLFCEDIRNEVKANHPEMNEEEIILELDRMWKENEQLKEYSTAIKKDIYKLIKELKKTIKVEKEKKPKNKKKTKTQEWKEIESEDEEGSEEEEKPKKKRKLEEEEDEDVEEEEQEQEEEYEEEDEEEEDMKVEQKQSDPKKSPFMMRAFALFYKEFIKEFGSGRKEEALKIWDTLPKEEKDEYISRSRLKIKDVYLPQQEKEKEKEIPEFRPVIEINDEMDLSPYSYSFIVVGNFIFPSVMHYIVFSLYRSLDHSVLDSHNFIMKEKDIALPREYSSYRELSELFSMYHNEEGIYLRNVIVPQARLALLAKFSLNEQMRLLLDASYPKQLIYQNNNDVILGLDNQLGEMMMNIRSNLVGPSATKEFKKYISKKEEDMTKFQDKIKDILYVMETYQKDTNKVPDIKFVLNVLYHYKTCFTNYNVSFPPSFKAYIKELNNKLFLSDSDLKMLWNYFVSYDRSVQSKLVKESERTNMSQKNLEKEIRKTYEVSKKDVSSNFIKIVKKIKDVSKASLENCILFVYHLVSLSDDEPDVKQVLEQKEMIAAIKKELERNNLENNEAVCIQIAYMCAELMKQKDMSRLSFFSDIEEEVPSEDDVDIVYEVEESEEKDDDDMDRDDYGDEGDEEDEGYEGDEGDEGDEGENEY